MAKGQHLSRYQKGIVRRYYEHLDTTTLTKLQEAASDLFLETDTKKIDRLWKSVENALAKTAANEVRVQKILQERDVKGLAELVNGLSGPDGPAGKRNTGR